MLFLSFLLLAKDFIETNDADKLTVDLLADKFAVG